MTKVLVVADSAVSQAGLESVLKGVPDFETVFGLPEPLDWIRLLEEDPADVILVEGIDAAIVPQLAELAAEESMPAIVVLARSTERQYLARMLALGVRGILPYSASAAEIVAALRAAAEGLTVFHSNFQRDLFDDRVWPKPAVEGERFEPLTPREQEVLGLLSQGYSNKAIAARLYLSEHTVKFHLGMIFEKLGASSRTEAVAIGLRQGLIML
ncbi:LuxR C-terminal-related transcriptional regulator [Altericista sp. CCNU0014]|uniref:helix-turn-helix transcriptional regulator n=1 Tax=Altericista sp. CCNU0014 TaxID=3082949 RepID=UPI003850DAEE